jgi:ribosomal protein L40E
MRDASLLTFEFLFKTRVSEEVGRVYPESNRSDLALEAVSFKDVYEGVRVNDFKIAKVRGIEVLRARFRVLKRERRKKICSDCEKRNAQDSSFCRFCGSSLKVGKFDCKLREVWAWDNIRLGDPFVKYILEWLEHLKSRECEGRVWAISRQRAGQINKCARVA